MENIFLKWLQTLFGPAQNTESPRFRITKKRYSQLRKQAKILVIDRLNHFNQFYNFQFNKVFIKNTKTRWGSCSSKKNLNFNYRILMLPIHLQDYLIVHELCHLQEMNHGPKFWDLVAEQIPDYKKSAQELRAIRMR